MRPKESRKAHNQRRCQKLVAKLALHECSVGKAGARLMNSMLFEKIRLAQIRGPSNPNGPNRPDGPNPFGGPNRQTTPNGQPPRRGFFVSRWLLLIVVGLILWQVASFFFTGTGSTNACTLNYSSFYQQLTTNGIKDVTIQGDQVTGDLRTPIDCPGDSNHTRTASFQTTIPADSQNLMTTLDQQVTQNGLELTVKSTSDSNFWVSLLINVVPWLLFIGLIFLLVRRAGQGQQSVFNFGKSRAKLIT
jgi:cell division protease FtsH